MKKPICTVLLITYNHAPYIAKCIDSVLSQKTKYPFIIKIFDDASTDGSSDIIREYAKKYPHKIFPYISEQNQGAQANVWRAYNSIDTKYVCPMETDDYWCDDEKLELQITALEEHPQCSFASGQTLRHNTDKVKQMETEEELSNQYVIKEHFYKNKNILYDKDFMDMPHSFFSHMSSRCINMTYVDLSKIKNKESFTYDMGQFIYLFSKGPMFYHYKLFSIWNRTGDGASTSYPTWHKLQITAKALIDVNEDTNYVYWRKIYSFIVTLVNYHFFIADKVKKQEEKKNRKIEAKNLEKNILQTVKRIYLFDKIEIFKIRKSQYKTKYYIAGIPLFKKKRKDKRYIFYIGFIPIISWV